MSMSNAASSSSSANTILVLHDAELDPRPFLHRLTRATEAPQPALSYEEDIEVPWTIDNKYYTADITFRACPIDQLTLESRGVEVVIYLFEGNPPNPLSPTLVQLITEEPRDIALAVRILSPPISESNENEPQSHRPKSAREMSWEEVKELFDELGMETIDEGGQAEEDDERPISPLEGIRQTLMTHMWPDMIRKSLAVSMPSILNDDNDEENPEADEPQFDGAEFPVTFSNQPGPSNGRSISAEGVENEGRNNFPSLQELLSQLSVPRQPGDMAGLEALEGRQATALERLEMLELDDELFGDLGGSGMGGPGEEDYARLDDWLDDDGDGEAADQEGEGEGEGEEGFVMLNNDPSASDQTKPDIHEDANEDRQRRTPVGMGDTQEEIGEEGFDDDFAAFQSAPPINPVPVGGRLPLDPTPLLLHLQSVRAELMSVQDPEERRKRAGKEVEMIMRGLGMEAGLGLDDLDDHDFQ